MNDKDQILITGVAGFIGYHLAKRLCQTGKQVIGIDNMNEYYQTSLKINRIEKLKKYTNFQFYHMDIAHIDQFRQLIAHYSPNTVLHMAAQAGVRYSIENPRAYADSNIIGFLNILEYCRTQSPEHLIYASSSSVYGGNKRQPFSTRDYVDHPVSFYAATKKSNELMAHTYSHLYNIPATGLRFFTVYGPWGRPDMAYWKFTRSMIRDEPISLYNYGDMARDFTYIDDVIETIVRLIPLAPRANPSFDYDHPDPSQSWAPHKIYNIGATRPERLADMISILEQATGKKAKIIYEPMQMGDVKETWADVDELEEAVGFRPQIDLRTGLHRFVSWYRDWLTMTNGDR